MQVHTATDTGPKYCYTTQHIVRLDRWGYYPRAIVFEEAATLTLVITCMHYNNLTLMYTTGPILSRVTLPE
jgi:hypothetical protein